MRLIPGAANRINIIADSNAEVLAYAARESRVVITLDRDFARSVAFLAAPAVNCTDSAAVRFSNFRGPHTKDGLTAAVGTAGA